VRTAGRGGYATVEPDRDRPDRRRLQFDLVQPVAIQGSGHSRRALDPARTGLKARAAVAAGALHFVDVVVQHG